MDKFMEDESQIIRKIIKLMYESTVQTMYRLLKVK